MIRWNNQCKAHGLASGSWSVLGKCYLSCLQTGWKFLLKLNLHPPCDPALPLVGYFTQKKWKYMSTKILTLKYISTNNWRGEGRFLEKENNDFRFKKGRGGEDVWFILLNIFPKGYIQVKTFYTIYYLLYYVLYTAITTLKYKIFNNHNLFHPDHIPSLVLLGLSAAWYLKKPRR